MNYLITNSKSQSAYEGFGIISINEAISHLKKCDVVAVDTETTGFHWQDDKLLLLQISSAEHNYVIDCRNVDISRLAPMFSSKKVVKIFHNAKFDYKFLLANDIRCENIHDTMLAEQLIHCGKSSIKYSLDSVLDRHLDITMSKEARASFINHKGNFTKIQLVYAIDDTQYLIELRQKQILMLSDLDLLNVLELENKACLAFADMEYNGIYLNKDKWNKNIDIVAKELDKTQLELDQFIAQEDQFSKFKLRQIQTDMFTATSELRQTDMMWSSPSQVLRLFKVIIPELDSVNAKLIATHKNTHPIIEKYIHFKEQSKLHNAYGQDFYKYLHKDGKVHTSFQQILNTGRVSSKKPNMQQIPSSNTYRNAFVPKNADDVFVSSDFSSQELCIIAYGSGDPVWLKALEQGADLHSICAELIFDKKWKDADGNVAERKRLRTAVKSINFGLAYGMSEFKLADTLSIPVKEAKDMIKKYFTVFPAIKKFLTNLGNYGKDNGHIRTFPPYKRIRWFEDWKGKETDFAVLGSIERASKNTPIQGTGADMTKLALYKLRDIIHDNQYPVKLIMTVHDQIDTICHKDFAEQWSNILRETMESAALTIIDNGLLKSDTNITKQWSK
jgi:DNA polymerase-1|tara:strand:+ start:1362 stop:3209 length:1848 start_codon:yes stop_codon:yes gene_type:complete